MAKAQRSHGKDGGIYVDVRFSNRPVGVKHRGFKSRRGLQWSDVEFETGNLHLRRAKGGITTTHQLPGDELRALRALKRDAKSPFVFVSERGAPFSTASFAKLVERAGIKAGMPFKCHPHQLRHATGFALANRGVDTRTLQELLGHRSIQSTVRYGELAPGRFRNLWG